LRGWEIEVGRDGHRKTRGGCVAVYSREGDLSFPIRRDFQ
jgi:hypothetical protein